jgi:hypothetical protein
MPHRRIIKASPGITMSTRRSMIVSSHLRSVSRIGPPIQWRQCPICQRLLSCGNQIMLREAGDSPHWANPPGVTGTTPECREHATPSWMNPERVIKVARTQSHILLRKIYAEMLRVFLSLPMVGTSSNIVGDLWGMSMDRCLFRDENEEIAPYEGKRTSP